MKKLCVILLVIVAGCDKGPPGGAPQAQPEEKQKPSRRRIVEREEEPTNRIGDVELKVTRVDFHPEFNPPGVYLMVQMINHNPNLLVHYSGFVPSLQDEFGNRYKFQGNLTAMYGQVTTTHEERLEFELPLATAKQFTLDVPGEGLGLNGSFRIKFTR